MESFMCSENAWNIDPSKNHCVTDVFSDTESSSVLTGENPKKPLRKDGMTKPEPDDIVDNDSLMKQSKTTLSAALQGDFQLEEVSPPETTDKLVPRMVDVEHVKDPKEVEDMYPLNEFTRDGCYVCGMEGAENPEALDPCSYEDSPWFLDPSLVTKRVVHEHRMARSAWAKAVNSRAAAPLVQLNEDDVDVLPKVAESVICSKLSLGAKESVARFLESNIEYTKDVFTSDRRATAELHTAPKVEEPQTLKGFPLTRETKKKHFEKEKMLKKGEKREAILLLKKKEEELRKLKEEYRRQAQRQLCHREERKAEYERKKEEYLLNLAKETKVDLEILKKHGEEIYRKYRKECKEINDFKEKKLDDEIAIIEKLLKEEKLKDKTRESVRVSSNSRLMTVLEPDLHIDTLSWEKKMMEDLFDKARQPEALREENVMKTENEKQKEEVDVYSQASSGTAAKLMTKRVKRKSFKKQIPRASSTKGKTLVTSKYPTIRQSSRKSSLRLIRTFSKVEIPKKIFTSHIDPELLKDVKLYDEIMFESNDFLNERGNIPNFKDDTNIAVSPQSIVFQDFYPAQTFTQIVKLHNMTVFKMYCGLLDITVEPAFDEQIIEVSLLETLMLWPGQCREIGVIFSPIEWGTEEEIKGKIWFWTRHSRMEKCKFFLDVKCLRAKSEPVLLESCIEFPEVDWWNKSVYTKYLTIENRGVMDCMVYIKRHFHSDYETTLLSDASKTTVQSRQRSRPVKTALKDNSNSARKVDGNKLNPSLDSEEAHNENIRLISNILETILAEACSPFHVYLTRGRKLKGYTSLSIPIRFNPRCIHNIGFAEEEITILFESFQSPTKEQTVKLTGSICQPVLEVPPLVDMSALILGGTRFQVPVTLRNTIQKFLKIKAKIPAQLQKHFQIEPSNLTLRPLSQDKVVVRAKLLSNFYSDVSSEEFFNPQTGVLEFPITLYSEGHPPTNLPVLATVSKALDLTIEPEQIVFGVVYTTETAAVDFWVTNHSCIPHQIAFLNIPKWGLIMPDHGYTTIGPCEKRRFELLYSPTCTEAGKPGGQAIHTFKIKCTTFLSLTKPRNVKNLIIEEEVKPVTENDLIILKEEIVNNFKNNEDLESLKVIPSEHNREMGENQYEESEVISLEEQEDTMSFLRRSISDYCLEKLDKEIVITETAKQNLKPEIPLSLKLKMGEDDSAELTNDVECEVNLEASEAYVSISCRALVVDPLCQLSQQRIVLTPTPLTSFTLTQLSLSCPSKLCGPSCKCGVYVGLDKDPRAKVTAHFEFFSNHSHLTIQPAVGDLLYGECKPVFIKFKPEFNEGDLKKQEKSLKVDKRKHAKPSHGSSFGHRSGDPKNTMSSNKSGSVKQQNSTIDVYNTLKMELLKETQPYLIHAKVQCLISTTMMEAPFTSRVEVLNCNVICPVTRPDFFIKSSRRDQVLEFPCTGIGLKSEEIIEIHNIANKTIFLTKSLLDIDDSFYTTMIPNHSSALPHGPGKGLMLEPMEYIRIKIIYCPKRVEKNTQYLEFTSNLTTIQYKLTGEATYPHFVISPQFSFVAMESFPGQTVEENITISNDGEVPVYFKVMTSSEREAYGISFESQDIQENIFHRKKVPKNSSKKPFLLTTVSDWTSDLLEHRFNESMTPNAISVEPKKLRVNPSKQGHIKIIFSCPKYNSKPNNCKGIPRNDDASEILPKSVKSGPNPISECNSEPVAPVAYAKCIQLVLGIGEIVASWTVISFLREKKYLQKSKILNSKVTTPKSDLRDSPSMSGPNTTGYDGQTSKYNSRSYGGLERKDNSRKTKPNTIDVIDKSSIYSSSSITAFNLDCISTQSTNLVKMNNSKSSQLS